MKPKLLGAILFALVCWAIPVNWIWGKTIDQPKPNLEADINRDPASYDYSSEAIVIKNNAIQPTLSEIQPIRKSSVRAYSNDGRDYLGKAYSKEEVQQLIRDYSAQYGIPAEIPLCVARLESGFNQFSKSKLSTASGVFQYLSATWASTDEGKAGLSVFDADANVRAAIKYMASRKSTSPWVVGPQCPSLT